jgi:N-acetylmuramoyl-L-alanine amidase
MQINSMIFIFLLLQILCSAQAQKIHIQKPNPVKRSTLKKPKLSKKPSLAYSKKQTNKVVFRRDGKKFEDTIPKNPAICKVVIDPGHGGKDPGREASKKGFLHEKDLALEVAILVGEYLEEIVPGISLIYTREDDVTVSLEERVSLANRLNADYFVSIHLNSNPNRYIKGTRTHIHDHNFKVSRTLALAIENQYQKAGLISRGIQSAKDRGENLYVLQYTEMPGVLTEAGFLTNPEEEAFVNSPEGQQKIARCIANALVEVMNSKYRIEVHKSYYCVQIEASEFPLDLNSKRYKDLGMQVREILSDSSQTYRYKYVVGREYDEALARELAAKVRLLGFKGAFVIKIEPQN